MPFLPTSVFAYYRNKMSIDMHPQKDVGGWGRQISKFSKCLEI